MSKAIVKNTYDNLVNDISKLYESARKTLVKTYWEIGRRIVEVEQSHEPHAEYGEHLIERLSKDLSQKYGEGFSKSNLANMRQFYLIHPILQTSGKLDWSKYVALLSVEDKGARERLERKVEKEGLSTRQVREMVREEEMVHSRQSIVDKDVGPDPRSGRQYSGAIGHSGPFGERALQYERGELYVFGIVDPVVAGTPKGFVTVDCGFNLWNVIEKKKLEAHKYLCIPFFKKERRDRVADKPSYTYAATVEQVIDGDTVWVRIDCGFGVILREKVRLRGIDAPEVTTAEGQKAKAFVQRRLPKGSTVVVRTLKSDKYDRYLADLFYGTRSAVDGPRSIVDSEIRMIAKTGTFLNQELLDQGLAVQFTE